MKVIYNKWFPFGDFRAITILEWIFVKKPISPYMLNHEKIHIAQQRELLYIGFYVWYFVEWFTQLHWIPNKAYRVITFEQEAYENKYNLNYLHERKHYAWVKYLFDRKVY